MTLVRRLVEPVERRAPIGRHPIPPFVHHAQVELRGGVAPAGSRRVPGDGLGWVPTHENAIAADEALAWRRWLFVDMSIIVESGVTPPK